MIKKLPILITAAGVMFGVLTATPAQADEQPTAADWSCNMYVTGAYAPCVQNTPTTGDETWNRGYKVTFNWEVPLDQIGNPYERCVLTYYKPAYSFYPVTPALEQIDVPAAWGTYTMPLSQQQWLNADGVVPGATTLTEEYYCYTPGVGASMRVTSDNAIIPDMPPTEPTEPVTTVTPDGLDVTASGSEAVGVSPLEGYTISVTDSSNTVVDSTTADLDANATTGTVTAAAYHASGVRVMAATAAKPTAVQGQNTVSRLFKNLKPGTYKVAVASYNRIGQSDTTVKTVTVNTPAKNSQAKPATKQQVAKVRTVHTKVTGKNVKVTWQAPKATKVTGYRVELVKAGKVIKRAKVGVTKHVYTFHKVAKGTYTVRVIDSAPAKRDATVTKTVKVKQQVTRRA